MHKPHPTLLGTSLTRHGFARAQVVCVTVLVLLATANYLVAYAFAGGADGGAYSFLPLRLIDVGEESSLPTLFSTLNLLLAAFFLFVIQAHTRRAQQPHRYWLVLAVGFAILCLDEGIGIHETIGAVVRKIDIPIPVLRERSWLIVGIPVVIATAIAFLPFLSRLDRRTATRFVLAGALFVAGAVGFELAGAAMLHTEVAETGDLVYRLRRIAEEGFEMAGVAVFNVALFDEVARRNVRIELGFDG